MEYQKLLLDYVPSKYSSPKTLEEFPYYTSDGDWVHIGESQYKDWVSGFWAGILWLAAEISDDFEEEATRTTEVIEPIYEYNFNIGFRYQYSWLAAYENHGDPYFKNKALEAAERLGKCYHEKINMICQKNGSTYPTTANDVMMNIPLLLWARKYSPKSEHLTDILVKTLQKAETFFIKNGGTVRHKIHFDPDTGRVTGSDSPQGFNGGCWSRGLAWTAYGFIMAGICLDEPRYIKNARELIAYHKEHSYKLIPAYDYAVSRIQQPRLIDTSTASILASSLALLGIVGDHQESIQTAKKIVKRLNNNHLRNEDESGILDGGCYDYPQRVGVDEACVWGDYYFLEATFMVTEMRLPIHLNWISEHPVADVA